MRAKSVMTILELKELIEDLPDEMEFCILSESEDLISVRALKLIEDPTRPVTLAAVPTENV
jgi:hypothetical protein